MPAAPRRLTVLAAASALATGCMSYQAAPGAMLRERDVVLVTSTTPLEVRDGERRCLATEVEGTVAAAHRDTLTIAALVRLTSAGAATDCDTLDRATFLVSGVGTEVKIRQQDGVASALAVVTFVAVGVGLAVFIATHTGSGGY